MADTLYSDRSKNSGHPNSKDKILTAAQGEFGQFGLAGARVDRIAQQAGVNKAMIYYHFKSKEGLYREVTKDFLARQIPAFKRELSDDPNLEAVFKKLLDFHAELFFKNPETLRLYLRELADPNSDTVASVAEIMKSSGLPDELMKILSAGTRSGAYRPVDVRQAIISFVSMSLGFFLMSPVFEKVFPLSGEPAFIEERKVAIVDLFMNGVKAR